MFEDCVIVPLPANRTHRGITGSILKMKDGTLLFAYSAVEGALLSKDPGGIAARKSADFGRTWGNPFLLQPRPGLGETAHPSLVRLPDGSILFAYDVQNLTTDDPNAGGDQHTYVRLSPDDGRSWSDPFCATLMPGICHAMPDKVVQLSSGRIIMPVESPWPVGGRYFVSRDAGRTWQHHRGITHDPEGVYGDYGYPGITFVEDGQVAMVNYHAIDGIHLARIRVGWFYGE